MSWDKPRASFERLSENLVDLRKAAMAVSPTNFVGLLRRDAERSVIVYVDALGMRASSVRAADLPQVLQPRSSGLAWLAAADLTLNPHEFVETYLFGGAIPGAQREPYAARQLCSVPVPELDPPILLVFGISESDRPAAAASEQLETIARRASGLATSPEPSELELKHLRRLRAVDALQLILANVLDVRGIFDRVSAATQEVLPHDMVALGLFNEDGQIRVYAQTADSGLPQVVANPYPPVVTDTWLRHIIDDIQSHPLERLSDSARLGFGSSLSLSIRLEDRLIGGLAFYSRKTHAYTAAEMTVGERITAHVALALSHQRLADEARQIEVHRERTANLQMLDELLKTLVGVLDVRQVFDRVSEIAGKVLSHEALLIREMSNAPASVRNYAFCGFGELVFPPEGPITRPELLTEPWDYVIVDDMTLDPQYAHVPATSIGLRSFLSLPVRLEGRLLASVNFFSRTAGQYTRDDVIVGRRITDHIALAYSHQRLAEESGRTAALQERAANLEMLDGLLTTLSGVLDVREVFDRVSDLSQKVLPHDAVSIGELIDNGEHVRMYANQGLSGLPMPFEAPVPDRSMLTGSWDARIVDDVTEHPEYAQSSAIPSGMRSILAVPIRMEGRLHGGLTFYSRLSAHFKQEDVLVAKRIADHIALALSHQRLAEEARRNEELRARTANLQLLDDLLATMTDGGELAEVFDRISTIAKRFLQHDTLALTVLLPDGAHARLFAASGLVGPPFPAMVDAPAHWVHRDWEYEIVSDAQADGSPDNEQVRQRGYRSVLRVPIKLEGRFAAALVFVSMTPSLYSQPDVMVARRIADRIALSLSRERRVDAMRRADEATTRASQLEARVRALTEELDSRTGYRRVVGQSASWRQVLTQATQVAATETTALLLGESGTGKEVVARFIHRASGRSGGPFVALNCAALPEQLLEAELFGYERGAFTGATQSKPGQLEQAGGGTLFLDEVGEMSPTSQAKFLRVLQEREFQRLGGTRVLRTDARVVAATNRDLRKAITQGLFREDLYYRLHVFAIQLPPLRDRRDDILPLSEAFLADIARGLGRPPSGISRDARAQLLEYHWPGNVRELRNVLERAAILCEGGLITSEHLALAPAFPAPAAAFAAAPPEASSRATAAEMSRPAPTGDLKSFERSMIEQALRTARFNKSKAAKELGLTRAQLYVRMKRYGLE
jgi:transcriptional regulator with GAF, ATPase, and Fis domain